MKTKNCISTRRRATLGALSLAGLGLPWCVRAQQDWLRGPVKLVVSFAPGSATDIVSRLVAEVLQNKFQQSFVVDNRPGANGTIAANTVANSPADGHTLFVTTATVQAIMPHLMTLPYNPARDFSAVVLVCAVPYLLVVGAQSPVSTVAQFLDWGAQQADLSYAYSNGPGQIFGAMLAARARLGAVGVPYKGSLQAMMDVDAGRLSYMFADMAASRTFTQSGKLRVMAIAAGQRSPQLPDVPTMGEASGLQGFDLVSWIVVLGPAGLSPDIRAQLNAVVNGALKMPDMIEKLAFLGADPMGGSVAQAEVYMAQQLEIWGRRVQEVGMKAT